MSDTIFGVDKDFVTFCADHFVKKGDVLRPDDSQLDILQEECAELIHVLSKIKRKGLSFKNYADLKEEMSHVLISIGVVSILCGVEQKHIDEQVNLKLEKYKLEYSVWREEKDNE